MDQRSSCSSSSRPTDAAVDSSSPLLAEDTPNLDRNIPNSTLDRNTVRVNGLSGAARFFRRASGRRMMREPSMMVRETAAEQLEERQSDWAYSKPVVILDLIWNLAFVMVSLIVLCISINEKPNTPLRIWICGYCLQCIVHTICVSSEFRRRYRQYQRYHHQQSPTQQQQLNRTIAVHGPYRTLRSSGESLGDNSPVDEETGGANTSFAKRLESMNTMFSFIWWIVGFYWITAGGQVLIQEAPKLYWLSVVFLAFDVLFVVFCVALACVIGIAVCCCLPCIIAILYAVADQDGASDEEINALSKFTFRRTGSFDNGVGEKPSPSKGIMIAVGSPEETKGRLLTAENAECCICLSAYEDGAELRELPCGHHFHCACIDKWLHINATCPLCKYNIIKSNNTISEEV